MTDRYTDEQLARLREAVSAIEKMCADGTMYDLFRGKVLLLEGEIAREERARAEERAAAEAEAAAAAQAESQENENPPA